MSHWRQEETIILVNDGTGLGFGIVGGKTAGVIVRSIVPGTFSIEKVYFLFGGNFETTFFVLLCRMRRMLKLIIKAQTSSKSE